jgi:small subunit ribosomal protein S14
MAKLSSIQNNLNREKKVKQFASRRQKLKETAVDKTLSTEERFAATLKLAALPRNGAKIRIRNRCQMTGRARGNYRKFGLSRNAFRRMASFGALPGVTKSSW